MSLLKPVLNLNIFPVLACLTFLILGLGVNIIQLLLIIFLPTHIYRTINYYLMYSIYGYLLFLGDWWSHSRMNVYAEEELAVKIDRREGGENALVVMNHHTELDWLYAWMGTDRLGVLGNAKVFAKDSLKYAPIIGWAWAMSDTVFLKRNLESDRENMRKKLNTMFSYPSPVWLLLFPEGTRFSEEKHAASQEFASKMGLPCLKHHLIPRTKGFSFFMDTVDRSKVLCVYDITLVENTSRVPFSLSSVLKGDPTEADIVIRRIPMASIPRDHTESAAWLVQLFKEKDELKEKFLTTGSFPQQYRKVKHQRRVFSLCIFLTCNVLVIFGLAVAMLSGGLALRCCILASLCTAWIALSRFKSIASLAHASKQGLDVQSAKDK